MGKHVAWAFPNVVLMESQGGLQDNRIISFLRGKGHDVWMDDINDECGYLTGKRGIYTTPECLTVIRLKYVDEKALSDAVIAHVRNSYSNYSRRKL